MLNTLLLITVTYALLSATPTPTPTPDRLAAPPTVVDPSQADSGAQLYWLNCQPCHGDRGQGLTDEWRAQYPPEEQNCWKSGCHGDKPYENGFKLPRAVPALVGTGALARFDSAADMHAFISKAMPFNKPGSLKPDEYWAIEAYLLRANGLVPATPAALGDANAAGVRLHSPAPAAAAPAGDARLRWALIVAAFAAVALAGWLISRRRRRRDS